MENGKSIVTLHPFALTAMVHLARPITQEKAHGTGDEGGRTPQARLMTQTAPSPSRTVYHDEASATAPAPRTEHDAPCPQPGAALRQVPSAGPSPHGADDGAQAMSHAITRLRFPLILLVVLMHSTGYPALSRHHVDLTRLDAGGVYDLVRLALAYVLGAGAVPCFFLISGYLFYYSTGGRLTRHLYTRKVRRRIHSLLLPYLLWNVLALLLLTLTRQPHYSLAELYHTLLAHPAQTLYGWLWSGPKGYPVNVPLWYMRDLLVLTLAAPALPWLSASRYPVTHWRSWLLPAALVAAYLLRLWPPLDAPTLVGAVCFSIGAWLSLHGVTPLVRSCRGLLLLSAVAMLTGLADLGQTVMRCHWNWLHGLWVLTLLPLLFSLAARPAAPVSRTALWLSAATVWVYCAHDLAPLSAIDSWLRPLEVSPHAQPWAAIACFLASPLLKTALLLVLYRVMTAVAPRLLALFTGSRRA